MRPVDLLLERLKGARELNGFYRAFCPAHDDRNMPNLDIEEGDEGQALVICRAGCKTEKVVAALGLKLSDLFPGPAFGHRNGHEKEDGTAPTIFRIRNVEGELQAEHLRYDLPGGHKKCLWRVPGGGGWGLGGRKLSTLPLYRSELLKDWPEDVPVVVVEGEKAADFLAKIYPAVLGTVTGAEGCPGPEVLGVLRSRTVVLWPDADEPGHRHMRQVAGTLAEIASEVRIFEWEEAPKKGDAADHPAVTSQGKAEVGELLSELALAPAWDPGSSSSSSLPPREDGGDDDAVAEVVWLSELGEPREREFLVEDLLPAGYMTTLYGSGGAAKSILALKLCVAYAAGLEKWLGLKLNGRGGVLYLDFELDADEQLRRARELCSGLGEPVPGALGYLSALGKSTSEAFGAALEVCRRHDVRLLIVDSLGPAMLGDAERARDFIAFHNEHLAPLRKLGVTVLVIDHQGKLQAGEKYQDKGAFGTAYKSHLSRSVVQVERIRQDRDAGALTIRLRHTKANFGPQHDPLDVALTFRRDSITAEPTEVDATKLAGEKTLHSDDRVLLALKAVGESSPTELAEKTGLAVGTVKNSLTRLRRAGLIDYTGNPNGRAQQVRLSSSSPRLYGEGGDDDAEDGAADRPETKLG